MVFMGYSCKKKKRKRLDRLAHERMGGGGQLDPYCISEKHSVGENKQEKTARYTMNHQTPYKWI